jgi:hypothetical protein
VGSITFMIESSDNTVSREKLFTLFFSSNIVHPVRFFAYCPSYSFPRTLFILFFSSNIVHSDLFFEYCSGSSSNIKIWGIKTNCRVPLGKGNPP